MWPDVEKLEPVTAADIMECTTPQGMRKRMEMVGYYNNSWVCRVFDLARLTGLSGEDKYTILAFEALKQVEALQEQLIDKTNRCVCGINSQERI